ncbi:MAG: hypothetical protein PHQ33_01740 [Bacteroidales bacterium]|jgi:hypothetical protein|nr:hypothetical protein [Bacteroidales bacterium]
MIKKITAFFLLLLPALLLAQYDAPLRIELEDAKDEFNYHLANAGNNGLFVAYEGNRISEDSINWVFLHYDTNLQNDYHFILPFPLLTEFITYKKSDNYLYFLLQKRFPKKSASKTSLVTVNLQNNQYNVTSISNLTNNQLAELFVRDHEIVIRASDNKSDSLFFYDCLTNTLSTYQSGFTFFVEFCELDTFNHRWLFGLNSKPDRHERQLLLYERDYLSHHEFVQPFPASFPDNSDFIYNSARAAVINQDTTLIIGTYNTFQDKNSAQLHSGVYTLQLHKSSFDSAKFYNYSTLKTKTDVAFDSEVNNNILNFQLFVGDIFHNRSQYTLATEVYYPEYNNNYSYSGTQMYNYQTFVGFRYVNAYVTTFDAGGNLLWDNYFPFSNLLSQQLTKRLSVEYLGDEALVFYPYNSYIIHTLLRGYDVVERMASIKVENSYAQDKVEYCKNPEVFRWYDDYYLATGYQYIRSKAKNPKSKRYVFYINKLQYK